MTKSVKAVKPMMADDEVDDLSYALERLAGSLCSYAPFIEDGSPEALELFGDVIEMADALYKAAGAK